MDDRREEWRGDSNSVGDRQHTEPCGSKVCYEIRFKGHLGDYWAAWFHGCSLTREADGTTTMLSPVTDQAELFGLLNKVRDLSLSLISVREIEFGGKGKRKGGPGHNDGEANGCTGREAATKTQ